MNFAFTEEQEELREVARSFLADQSGSEQVRHAMESERGFDPELWKQVGELGWAAVAIPEAYGGLELSQVELAALLELMGEHLLCAPFFSTVCLAGNALLVAGSEAQKLEWLPRIAEGTLVATLAHAEGGASFDPTGIATTAEASGDGIVLRGAKRYVVDGASAELLVVAAREPGSSGPDGVGLYLVAGDAAGLARSELPTMDRTRRQAEIVLDGVRIPAAARLEAGDGEALVRILDLATVGLCAEAVGGAQRCLDLSVAFANEREQFGRPIGSFQAIKHKCANMMLRVESARSAAYYAACVAAESPEALPRAASLAKAYGSEAYFACAGEAIQIHGGVGFTWEYDPHLYFKRAQASEQLLGDPAYHRERIARELELG